MKGVTEFDKLCHRTYDGDGDGADYLLRNTHILCRICGFPLYAYYCEEQLILIECKHCRKKALVKARNIRRAAYETFGSEGEVLMQAATVDAVPVVRCEDCRFWEAGKNECESWEYCKLLRRDMPQGAFCSYGERRVDNAEAD